MAKSKNERRDTMRRAVAIVLAVLLIGTILYSVIPVFGLAEEETPKTHYALNMAIDLDNQAIAVSETVDYVNATGRSLDAVWLNVYPNALRRADTVPVEAAAWNDAFPNGYAPGGVDFISVTVNGEKADWAVSGSGEAFMRIACPLEPGEAATISLRFRLLVPVCDWFIGVGDLGWRLVNAFPIVCAYDEATRDFVLNSWTVAVDPLASDVSDWEAMLSLPSTWLVASTGVAAAAAPDDRGMATWQIVATDARTGKAVYFPKEEIRKDHYDFLKASCCVPIFNRPYPVGEGLYFDGGLADPIPIRRLLAKGCDRAVVILTRPKRAFRKPGKEPVWARLLKHNYPEAAKVLRDRWQIYNTELQIVLELERSGKALIIAPDSIGSLKILTQDHTQLDQLYEKGLKDAEKIRGFLND